MKESTLDEEKQFDQYHAQTEPMVDELMFQNSGHWLVMLEGRTVPDVWANIDDTMDLCGQQSPKSAGETMNRCEECGAERSLEDVFDENDNHRVLCTRCANDLFAE